jgi:ABC-2 type transport system permease protein
VIALLRSEARRLRSRRLVWILTILALLGILVGVSIAAATSHRPTPAQEAAAQENYQSQIAQCVSAGAPPGEVPTGESLSSYCAQQVGPPVVEHALILASLPDFLKGTSFILIVIGLVIGASLVGADWQSGTMGTLLTWESRRIRLLLTRALVVAVSMFLLAVFLQVVLSLGIWGAASIRGSTIGTGGGFVHSVVGVMLRIGVMAALISLVGVAVSTVGRTTGAALGVVFVYLALVESLLHGLVPRIARWLLSVNTAVFVDGKAQNVSDSSARSVVVTPGHATFVVIAYAAILMAVATAFFRSRDVT